MTHYQHTDQYISSYSDNTDKGKRITANLNYQYHAENGKNYLIADVDYLYYTGKQNVINEMNNVDEQGEFQSLYLKEWQRVPQNTSVYSAKVEYGGKFGDGFKYDFGADAYYSAIRTNNEYLGWEDNDFVFDSELSSDFDVDEFTPALFVDISKTWNDNFFTSLLYFAAVFSNPSPAISLSNAFTPHEPIFLYLQSNSHELHNPVRCQPSSRSCTAAILQPSPTRFMRKRRSKPVFFSLV